MLLVERPFEGRLKDLSLLPPLRYLRYTIEVGRQRYLC